MALAARLRERAEAWMATDPYAKPYWATTAIARKLSAQMTARHGDRGPELAMQELWARTLRAERKYDTARLVADRATERLAAVHAEARTERATERGHLTFGQRIDRALAQLEAISSVPAARADDDLVHGGEAEQAAVSIGVGEELAQARAVAADAAWRIERELDEARGRNLERALEAA